MNIKNLTKDYQHIITALNNSGVISVLPRSRVPGVIGIDGKEYPVPTQELLQEVFARNKELVDLKMRQGFTQLLLTPIAMPISKLIELVIMAIQKHTVAGKLFQTKQDPADPDIPVRVNKDEQIWVWSRVLKALDTPHLVYFPQKYINPGHHGFAKGEVIRNSHFCAAPGWSVALIEPMAIMPLAGQAKIMGDRKQLEPYSTPRDYLQILSAPAYQGETGWTLEDFLTHFITQLETTNQVSHDRFDSNALWLLGSYLPDLIPTPHIVMEGFWSRKVGHKIYLSAHRSGNRFHGWVARTAVRLG